MPKRLEQVNELLHREIAIALTRHLELPNVLATVTAVTTTADLKSAKVFVSVLPAGHAGSALQAIRRQQGLIYTALKKRLTLRSVPVLSFHFDETEAQAAKVREAIDEGLMPRDGSSR